MASPTQDTIDTYMSITGASHSVALLKLQEHGGNLNEAVDAHFNGGDIDFANPGSATTPHHNFAHMNRPNQVAPYAAPQYHPTDMNGQNQFAPHATPQYNYPSAQNHDAPQGIGPLLSAARSFKPSLLFDRSYSRDLINRIGSAITGRAPSSSHPEVVPGVPVEFNRGNDQPHLSGQWPTHDMAGNSHGNDVEEEMIRAAIEASKREAEVGYLNTHNQSQNVSPVNGIPEKQVDQDNDDFDRALSLSLKTAEQEKTTREEQEKAKNQEPGIYSTWKLGSISPEELDEAILLEKALFGESSQAPNLPSGPSRDLGPNMQPVCGSSSSSLTARQLLREQQDEEYLASILADKEKEMNGVNEAGTCALKEIKSDNKKIHPLEFERRLDEKGASLPCEPASDDQNAVSLLVKMPNGSRLSRRFHKSDKLQLLFDFIDVGRVVKPGTYRVVRSYPRRAFTVEDSLLSLSELGLTNKQEALFLELI